MKINLATGCCQIRRYKCATTCCTNKRGRFFSVRWGHHLYIISQCKDVDCAVFYLKKTVENGWRRTVLLNFLDTNYKTEIQRILGLEVKMDEC